MKKRSGEFKEQAEKDVRRSLIVREIIQREELQLQEQDLQTELARFLADFGPERQAEAQAMLENPRMGNVITSAALDRKLRDRLVAIAKGETDGAHTDTTSVDEAPTSDDSTTPEAVAPASSEATDGEERAASVE